MKSFNTPVKIFVKSNNDSIKIINKYNLSLIYFSIITIIINIFIGNKELSFSLIKSIIISLFITTIISYIINIIKKEYNILKLYTEDSIISISIIIAFFSINTNIYIIILSILVTIIIKTLFKNINISSSLYGILLILLYKYLNNNINTPLTIASSLKYNLSYGELIDLGGGVKNYLFGISYLNPILSIFAFIYLFSHKSIKYSLVFSYILTFFLIMSLYGIFNGLNIWFSILQLLTGATLFLSIYTLPDYKITPITSEGNIIYGIILAIISVILRLIIPELSIILTFIIGPILLTNIIDKISPTLKYNNKLYIGLIIFLMAIIIFVTYLLSVLI